MPASSTSAGAPSSGMRDRRLGTLSAEERRHLTELDFEMSAVILPPGCYLNHSCDPNAMRSGVTVFAWRAIRKGEEITIDYRLNAFGDHRSRCLCGSRNCGGLVTWSFFALDPERQRQYLPYAPAFILREFRRWRATDARAVDAETTSKERATTKRSG